jgi:hypothetical protein
MNKVMMLSGLVEEAEEGIKIKRYILKLRNIDKILILNQMIN